MCGPEVIVNLRYTRLYDLWSRLRMCDTLLLEVIHAANL